MGAIGSGAEDGAEEEIAGASDLEDAELLCGAEDDEGFGSDGEMLDGGGGVDSDCDGTDELLFISLLAEQAARINRASTMTSVSIVVFNFIFIFTSLSQLRTLQHVSSIT